MQIINISLLFAYTITTLLCTSVFPNAFSSTLRARAHQKKFSTIADRQEKVQEGGGTLKTRSCVSTAGSDWLSVQWGSSSALLINRNSEVYIIYM